MKTQYITTIVPMMIFLFLCQHSMCQHFSYKPIIGRKGYATKVVDLKSTDTGRITFIGHKSNPEHRWKYEDMRPIKYDLERDYIEDLISTDTLSTFLTYDEKRFIYEISSDRDLNRLALNILRIQKGVKPVFSTIVVLDLNSKTIHYRKEMERFHEKIKLSDDGRFLASYTHPGNWFREFSIRSDLIGNRVDIIDLEEDKLITVTEECLQLIPAKRFHWAKDSRNLFFPHSNKINGDWKDAMKKWSADDPENIIMFPLEGKRQFIYSIEMLPDQSILCCTTWEIFQLDQHLENPKVIYSGDGLHDLKIIDDQITLYDKQGKVGMGVKIELPLDQSLSP